ALELQPIGRSALDAIAGAEADSDPGEETIELADLESGAALSALAVTSASSRGPREFDEMPSHTLARKPGSRVDERPQDSLGMLPGTPRAGPCTSGQARPRKDRERESGSWLGKAGKDTGDGKVSATQSGQKLRYCKQCNMHQPLRTKHCRDCGRCVRTHDHHCPWVGTCVGEGNRLYFFWFLVAQW
ncbi:unnamed protein product, partial [Polarella glacialis]